MMNVRKPTITTLAAAALLLAAQPAPAQRRAPAKADDLEAVAEQIDIMRLVLARAINDAGVEHVASLAPDAETAPEAPSLPGGDEEVAALAYQLYTVSGWRRGQFTSHTRGYYARGLGAIFTTEVQTPVHVVEPPEGADNPDEPDEWDEASRLVHSGRADGVTGLGFALGTTPGRDDAARPRAVLDEEFVQAAIEAVLGALGKHGRRIEDLPGDEKIVVGIEFSPDASPGYTGLAPVVVGSGRSGSRAKGGGSGGGGAAGSATALFNAAVARAQGARRAEPLHVVISIDRAALDRLEGSESRDVQAVRRAATITRY